MRDLFQVATKHFFLAFCYNVLKYLLWYVEKHDPCARFQLHLVEEEQLNSQTLILLVRNSRFLPIFHKSFFNSWKNPPNDFSLDLFAYFMAKKCDLNIKRFNVRFDRRLYGKSHWNKGFKEKLKFIKKNDFVIITAGMPFGKAGMTNMVRLYKVGS